MPEPDHMPPDGVPVSCMAVVCTHTRVSLPAETAGGVLSVTIADACPTHAFVSVPITVYEVFDEGLTTAVFPVVERSPGDEAHEYEFAPEAMRMAESPGQIETGFGDMERVGRGLTLIITVSLLAHPAELDAATT